MTYVTKESIIIEIIEQHPILQQCLNEDRIFSSLKMNNILQENIFSSNDLLNADNINLFLNKYYNLTI